MGDIALPTTGVPGLARGERLLSEERLAKLAARGSTRAFAALYERNHQAIYRYCRSILRHDQDAQDALQSTMMRAYAALRAEERELAVRPWLFRIAHNEAISLLRKRRVSAELNEDSGPLDGGVEAAMDIRERLATLLSDLQTLPERQRAALVMRELSGLSIDEIAETFAISSGAAKQTLFEARSSLHELAEGRAMRCESVMQAISSGDGRVLRGRRIRAHMRACEECRSFRAAIDTRRADLRALAPPLPAVAGGALLTRVLAQGGGHGGSATVSGASLGGHAAASLLTKGIAGVAVVAAAAAGTARLAASHRPRVTGPSGSSAREQAATTPPGSLPGVSGPSRSGLRQTPPRSPLDGSSGGAPAANNSSSTGPMSMPSPNGAAVNESAIPSERQARAHGHTQGTRGQHGSERNPGNRHRRESQSSPGGRHARHAAKPHGPNAHKPSREPHREGQGSKPPGSQGNRLETPTSQPPGHSDASVPRAPEAARPSGTERSEEARQAMPEPRHTNEGALR